MEPLGIPWLKVKQTTTKNTTVAQTYLLINKEHKAVAEYTYIQLKQT